MQGKADLISNNNNNKTAGLPAKTIKLGSLHCGMVYEKGQEKEKKSNISTLGVAQQNSCSICVRRG